MPMITCTRHGCGLQFDPDDASALNSGTACSFHPGNPIFHEGLKSWSCCKDVNKPVLDFESFIAIKGCVVGSHSADPDTLLPNLPKPVNTPKDAPTTVSNNGTEVYGALPPPPKIVSELKVEPKVEPPPPQEIVIEEDPIDAKIESGMICKRKGCGKTYDGGRKEGECIFHPGVPIFHEGSKGYSCCKRKVLEFDEFLKIEGCKQGNHLFIGKSTPLSEQTSEEVVTLRTDHYQTPTQVIVSVFGKGADKERSDIQFTSEQLHIQLYLPNNKKYTKTFNLYGPIVPEKCTWKIMGTKAEIVLHKTDLRSWPALDNGTLANSAFVPNLTFGVGGKRGTYGAKEMVLPDSF